MKNEKLESAIRKICEIEESLSQDTESVRDRVLREGKELLVAQREQKKEQERAKERGEPAQTWKEFCEEQKKSRTSFPHVMAASKYMRISQYPKAYESGMSIKEAYKMATKWKANNGNPPITSKVVIQMRLPNQVGVAAGKACNKLEKYNSIDDWSVNAESEKWTDDDFLGMEETLVALRKEIAISLSKIKRVRENANA